MSLDTQAIPLADLLSIYDIADLARVSSVTVGRWCDRGVDGIRLRYLKVGRSRRIARAWLDDFFARLTAVSQGEPAPPPASAHRARERELERVDAELTAIGI